MQMYKGKLSKYALGRRVNSEEWNTVTRNASADIAFGVPVEVTTGKTIKEWDGTGVIEGITEASQVLPHTGDNYAQYDEVPVCEVGVIGVKVEGASIVRNAVAYYNPTTKAFSAVAGAGKFLVLGATFDNVPDGDMALIRYRRVNGTVHVAAG